MVTKFEIFIDRDAKDVFESISNNIFETQKLVSEEVKKVVGDNTHEEEILKQIYEKLFNSASDKCKKHGGDFSLHIDNGMQSLLSSGVTLKKIHLSYLIFLSGLSAGKLMDSNIDDALRLLAMINSSLGEYKSINSCFTGFDTIFKDNSQENFKRDTLLKLIYGMANHAFKTNDYDARKQSICIENTLKNIQINIDNEEIFKYLCESKYLRRSWLEEDYRNKGAVTEKERESMLLIIIGIAIDKFNFDPKAERNTATGNKVGIGTRIEFEVHNDTVRSCLDAASKILDNIRSQ